MGYNTDASAADASASNQNRISSGLPEMTIVKVAGGIAIWLAILLGLGAWLTGGSSRDQQRIQQLVRFATGSRRVVVLEFSADDLVQVGDPIFLEGGRGDPPIGRIVRVENPTSREVALVFSNYAEAELFSTAPPIDAEWTMTLHQAPQSMGWVIQTMLSPEIRTEIARLLTDAFVQHQAEISARLQPIVIEALERSGEVIRRDFQAAVMSRSERIKSISGRYQKDFVEEQLTPLLRDEVWPIIQAESRPLAEVIGQQLWQKASIWRLTWRIMYDASPLPQRDLARKEFERFVQDHVGPTLQAHVPDLIELQKRIFSRVLENPRVRQVAQKGLESLARDSELHGLLLEILNDVITNNDRLIEVWREVWSTPEAEAALADANDRLEPTITAIGETMFGNPKKRITPEFSQVLRNKVLIKDQRWFVLRPPLDPRVAVAPVRPRLVLTVRPGDPSAPNPFHVPARPRQ